LPTSKVNGQSETRLRFSLKNVHSGQIKFMCASVGLTVVAMMTRLRIGRVFLSVNYYQENGVIYLKICGFKAVTEIEHISC